MDFNDMVYQAGNACYVFLAINFLWGLYNIIMGFRRVKGLSFRASNSRRSSSTR